MKVKQFLDDPYFILWKLSGEPLEGTYWETYLRRFPESGKDFEEACRILESIKLQKTNMSELRKKQLESRIFAGVRDKEPKPLKRTTRRYPYTIKTTIAMAAGLLLTLMVRNVFFTGVRAPDPVIVNTGLPQKTVELITSSGIINLGKDAVLEIDSTGSVHYENQSVYPPDSTAVELRVPYGKRSRLVLEDGSTLWINSGTTVRFPPVFEKDERRITVNGEIYIEVTRDPERTFSIATPRFDVNVYGTSFNLQAYRENPEATVALVEGSLAVTDTTGQEMFMAPNEKITINEGKFTKGPARIEEHISWHKGYLVFDRTPITDVLKALSRYYNIHFDSGAETLEEKTCTGKIFLSDDLQNVVETLSVLTDTSFHINKKAN